MKIFVLLPLLIVLGSCSKAPVVETEREGQQQQEVKEEVQPEEPVAEAKPAEAVSVSPNFKYEIAGDTVTITGCDRKVSGALIIPATIEGKSVTSIGNGAFAGCSRLTSITIGNSVTWIGESAFRYCTVLARIDISVGNSSFASVDGILFNKNQTTILLCPEGKSGAYSIPDSVTSIGDEAFSDCYRLTSITIPDSVTSIGNFAFSSCASLTSIMIPDSVTSIGVTSFLWSRRLTTIEVGAGNVNYTDVNGTLFNSEKTVLLTYPAGKKGANYNIPNSVTSIGDSAFDGCKSLTSITIGDGVTSIGKNAFHGCKSLTSVTIPDSVTSIGDYAFVFCESLTSITIPAAVTVIRNGVFDSCESLTKLIFLGDAPKDKTGLISTFPTIYRKPEAKGWGETFADRPVKLISEKP